MLLERWVDELPAEDKKMLGRALMESPTEVLQAMETLARKHPHLPALWETLAEKTRMKLIYQRDHK